MKTYKVINIPEQLKHFYKLNEMRFFNYLNNKDCCYGQYAIFSIYTSVYLDVCLENDLFLSKYTSYDIERFMRNFLK